MVRIKISIGIIAAIIILGVAGIFVLDHKTDRVIDMLEETKKYSDAGDTQMAIEAVGKLEQEWERYHTFASIFVRNSRLFFIVILLSHKPLPNFLYSCTCHIQKPFFPSDKKRDFTYICVLCRMREKSLPSPQTVLSPSENSDLTATDL